MKKAKEFNKEAKDGQIDKLRRRIHRLEKENERLKSEVKTLESYRRTTNRYIDNKLDGVPVEDVISGIRNNKKVDELSHEQTCPKCANELKIIRSPGRLTKICSNPTGVCRYVKVEITNETKSND